MRSAMREVAERMSFSTPSTASPCCLMSTATRERTAWDSATLAPCRRCLSRAVGCWPVWLWERLAGGVFAARVRNSQHTRERSDTGSQHGREHGRMAAGGIDRVPHRGRQARQSLRVAAERTGRHRHRHAIQQFPIAFPRGVVRDRVVWEITRGRAHATLRENSGASTETQKCTDVSYASSSNAMAGLKESPTNGTSARIARLVSRVLLSPGGAPGLSRPACLPPSGQRITA